MNRHERENAGRCWNTISLCRIRRGTVKLKEKEAISGEWACVGSYTTCLNYLPHHIFPLLGF